MFRFRQCLLFVCVFATLKTFVLVVLYSLFLPSFLSWWFHWFLPWKHWSSCKQVKGTPQGMRDSKRTWWSTCHKINWCLCWGRSNHFLQPLYQVSFRVKFCLCQKLIRSDLNSHISSRDNCNSHPCVNTNYFVWMSQYPPSSNRKCMKVIQSKRFMMEENILGGKLFDRFSPCFSLCHSGP